MTEITTAAELDALPVGSVVLDPFAAVCVRGWTGMSVFDWRRVTTAVDNGEHRHRPFLPATVLYRPDRPSESTLSDPALIEEAARRGMTVMDAAEAARLRGVVAEAETWHHAYDVDKAFRGRVAALADEWERQRDYCATDAPRYALLLRDHATALRALLSGAGA